MTSASTSQTFTFFLTSDVLRATDRSASASWETASTTSSTQQPWSWQRPRPK